MMRSLQSGVNGVRNHQLMMDVVGNNIANVNTIGFKSGRITFADTISELLRPGSAPRDNRGGINPVQVGLGMKVSSVDNNFNQGSLENTGYATDLAVQGNGFFVVRSADKTMYTRAGNFTIDAQGRLVAGDGQGVVQGRLADADGNLSSSALEDVVIPLQQKTPPKATTSVQFYCNLDGDATMADASLVDAGSSGVTSVDGTADDGIGGTHTIVIDGNNATNSTNTGTAAGGAGVTLTTRLSDVGVTTTDGFAVTMDEGSGSSITYNILGLTADSTVGDLLNQLRDQVAGGEFELVGGEIQVTRKYAGDGASYNIVLNDTGSSDVVQNIFNAGAAAATEFRADSGTASTLTAVDTFVDNASGTTTARTLTFEPDATTGLMTSLTGLGDGGVSILANNGFSTTESVGPPPTSDPLVIDTADTSHSTSITVYDEQGKTHNLTVNFTKSANLNEWKWEATVPDPALAISGNTGTVQFNTDGTLKAWTYDNNRSAFSFDPGTSQQPVNIAFNPGTLGGMDGITQTASPFTTTAINQDGYGMGTLESIDIDSNGQIVGNFSNGVDKTLAAIVLADFRNENGLKRAGDNLWESTYASGDPVVGLAETNLGSSIQKGFLEMSNVDLVKEFTEMITAQRGFQANARVITVSDQILTEVTNLKR